MSRRQTKGPRSTAYHEAGHAVDVSILDLARKELRAGEKLIWADQAGPMERAKTKIATFLLGIPFFGFSIFIFSTFLVPETLAIIYLTASSPYDLMGAVG